MLFSVSFGIVPCWGTEMHVEFVFSYFAEFIYQLLELCFMFVFVFVCLFMETLSFSTYKIMF